MISFRKLAELALPHDVTFCFSIHLKRITVGCMRQVLRASSLGRPRGMGWRGKWEGGSGWGTHINPWLIHFNVWQKPLRYSKVISLQLIKINEKKRITIVICEIYAFCFFCSPIEEDLKKQRWTLSFNIIKILIFQVVNEFNGILIKILTSFMVDRCRKIWLIVSKIICKD